MANKCNAIFTSCISLPKLNLMFKQFIRPAIVYRSISLFFFCLFLGNTSLLAQNKVQLNLAPDELTARGVDIAWEEGATVPNLSINDVNNKKFNLYGLLDKPLLIEIFALNCAACKKNKKYLKSFYRQFNINILSICPDDYPNEIRKLGRSQQLNWSLVYDDAKKLTGQSFTEKNNLGDARFILIGADKRIEKIFYSEREIGKLGVALQQLFK